VKVLIISLAIFYHAGPIF